MPVVFWAFLKFNKIPATAKAAVCSACIESRYYRVVIALPFYFLMTVVFATVRGFPSVTAFVLLICSACMLVLLTMLRLMWSCARTTWTCFAMFVSLFNEWLTISPTISSSYSPSSRWLGMKSSPAERLGFVVLFTQPGSTIQQLLRKSPHLVEKK